LYFASASRDVGGVARGSSGLVQGAHTTWPTSTSFTFQGTFYKKIVLSFLFHVCVFVVCLFFFPMLHVLVCCLTFCLFICCGLLLSSYGLKNI
jgi:hypothetical protein